MKTSIASEMCTLYCVLIVCALVSTARVTTDLANLNFVSEEWTMTTEESFDDWTLPTTTTPIAPSVLYYSTDSPYPDKPVTNAIESTTKPAGNDCIPSDKKNSYSTEPIPTSNGAQVLAEPPTRTIDNFDNVEDADTVRHSFDDNPHPDDTSDTQANGSSTRIGPNQTTPIRPIITPFQSNLLEHFEKNQVMTSNPSDMSVVMSFLPHMKLLNDEQKLEFHLNSLQYLKNIIKSPPTRQNVLRELQPQHPIPTTPSNFNNNYTMSQNSSSNLQYNNSSPYLNAPPYPYSYPTYAPPNYPAHNPPSSYSADHTVQTTLTPTSSLRSSHRSSPSNQHTINIFF